MLIRIVKILHYAANDELQQSRMLLPYKKWVHTITADNGTEFAEHKLIAKKLEAGFFFCHPYSR